MSAGAASWTYCHRSPGADHARAGAAWAVMRSCRVPRARPIVPAGAASAAAPALVGVILLTVAALLSVPGRPTLIVALWPLQILLVLGWLTLLAAPARAVSLLLAAGSALAADLLLARDDVNVLGALAGVVAVTLVLTIAAQLARRDRRSVTEVIAAQSSAALLAGSVACFVALRGSDHGRRVVVVVLLALAVGGVLGRLGGVALPRPEIITGRGVGGLVLWAAVGAAVGVVVLGRDGLLIGGATALAGAFADLAVVAGGAHRHTVILAALLPLSTAAPVAYVLGRVVYG